MTVQEDTQKIQNALKKGGEHRRPPGRQDSRTDCNMGQPLGLGWWKCWWAVTHTKIIAHNQERKHKMVLCFLDKNMKHARTKREIHNQHNMGCVGWDRRGDH